MKFGDDDNVNSSVEDRRWTPMQYGAGAGGLGIVGVVVVLLVRALGGDVTIGSAATSTDETTSGNAATGNAASGNPVGATPTAGESCKGVSSLADQGKFVACVETNVQNFWRSKLSGYEDAALVLYRDETASGCGEANSAVGPFYCPLDGKVYLDLGFFDELHRRFGAKGGDFAEAYVIAHEYGHHVQDILGTMQKVHRAERHSPQDRNAWSVKLELQADCYAGVWGHEANVEGKLEPGEVGEALDAASSVGDDRIQKRIRGRVNPETFTHGSAAERMKWFQAGMDSGDLKSCDGIFDSSPGNP